MTPTNIRSPQSYEGDAPRHSLELGTPSGLGVLLGRGRPSSGFPTSGSRVSRSAPAQVEPEHVRDRPNGLSGPEMSNLAGDVASLKDYLFARLASNRRAARLAKTVAAMSQTVASQVAVTTS